MQKKLVIAADVDPAFVERARADSRFEVVSRPVRTVEDLTVAAREAHVLVTRAYNRVTRGVIDAAPGLELIAQGTSGTDNIDVAAARERGIAVLSLPGGNANAVAELVIGLVISMTRTVPVWTNGMRNGRWERDDCATRHELRHHRLGIVGLGHVGRRVARLAKAFSMHVTAYDPYIGDDDFRERDALRAGSLQSLLAASDVVTLHVPLTDETRSMIGASELAAMPRGSFLVNTARGEVLDRDAALAALASQHLAGLALDVFDPEPPGFAFPDDPRLILTPHIAGCTFEAKAAIGAELWERVTAFYGPASQGAK